MAEEYLIGIDEVGRGSIAGPLCVGAFAIRRTDASTFRRTVFGIKDSKQLTARRRDEWFCILNEATKYGRCRWATAFVSHKVIDARGISFALTRAISAVLAKLNANPRTTRVLLDGGIKAPPAFKFQETVIRGDEKEPLIASASIMAKVCRDRSMTALARRYPQYGFERHKGYGTAKHYLALRKHGILEVHRKSFLKKFQFPSTKLQTISNSKIQKTQTKSV